MVRVLPPDLNPLVVYVSDDRTGTTFSLELSARRALEREFDAHSSSRVFVGHDTRWDLQALHGSVLPQVVLLLTGLSDDQVRELKRIEFREPVSERTRATLGHQPAGPRAP